jgi:hypothetical protein
MFDYSPQSIASTVGPCPLHTTRETALEAGLSRAFPPVESASGRMFIDQHAGHVARVTIYLASTEFREV